MMFRKRVVAGVRQINEKWTCVILARRGDRLEEIAYVAGLSTTPDEAERQAVYQLHKLGLRIRRFYRLDNGRWQ